MPDVLMPRSSKLRSYAPLAIILVVLLTVGVSSWGWGRIANASRSHQQRIEELNAQIKALTKEMQPPTNASKRRELTQAAERLRRERKKLRDELALSTGSPLSRRFLELFH